MNQSLYTRKICNVTKELMVLLWKCITFNKWKIITFHYNINIEIVLTTLTFLRQQCNIVCNGLQDVDVLLKYISLNKAGITVFNFYSIFKKLFCLADKYIFARSEFLLSLTSVTKFSRSSTFKILIEFLWKNCKKQI